MAKKPLILLGSARKVSDTQKVVLQLFSESEVQLLDLLNYKIYPYDYSGNYPADDQFEKIVQHLLAHQVLVWATPVYWYAMSGLMKVCFDRLTDLVTINKQLGRQLKGKRVFMVAVGAEETLPTGFEVPFQLTAAYFDMEYISGIYCLGKQADDVPTQEQRAFKENVLASMALY